MLFPSGSTLDHEILLISFALLNMPNHRRNDVNLLQCNHVDMHLEFTIHSSIVSVKLIVNSTFEKNCIMNFLIFKSKQAVKKNIDGQNHHKKDKRRRPKKG
jgi:hypothetical protein